MRATITPEMARKLLDKNEKNRNVSERQVEYLTTEILNDRFMFNGESIIVAENGALLDGQHRLMAVVKANKSIESILIEGVPNEAQKTIDVGITRTAANVLSMEGIKYSTVVAKGVRAILMNLSISTKKGGGRISSSEILAAYKKEEALLSEMASYTVHLYNVSSKIISAGQGLAYIYLFSLEDRLAKQFIKEVYTGQQVGLSNAAILLRNRLIDDKLSRKKMTETNKRDLVITAWKKYLRGEINENLKLTSEDLSLVAYGAQSKLKPRDFDKEDDSDNAITR